MMKFNIDGMKKLKAVAAVKTKIDINKILSEKDDDVIEEE